MEIPSFKREFIKSILLQILRGFLFAWCGRLLAKGYFTSGQLEYVAIGIASVLLTAGSVVVTSVLRFARAEALKRSTTDDTAHDVRQLMWQIVGKLLNLKTTEGAI